MDFKVYEFANKEIVKGAWNHFGARMKVHHMNTMEQLALSPDDVLLGHPPFPFHKHSTSWLERHDPNKCFGMAPWTDAPLHPRFAEPLAASRLVFGVGGAIWFDRSMQRPATDPFRKVCDKLVRVNMGCNSDVFEFRHDLGNRSHNFLHISALRHSKNPELLYAIFKDMPACLIIGSGSKPAPSTAMSNMKFMGAVDNSDPNTTRRIVATCAFYVHTSGADAQATTVLENCARGLVPIVTPESGFRSEYALYLSGDVNHDRAVISQAISMPADEYARRSEGVRRQVKEFHNWPRIYSRIEDCIRTSLAGDTIADRKGDLLS